MIFAPSSSSLEKNQNITDEYIFLEVHLRKAVFQLWRTSDDKIIRLLSNTFFFQLCEDLIIKFRLK